MVPLLGLLILLLYVITVVIIIIIIKHLYIARSSKPISDAIHYQKIYRNINFI